MYYWCEKHYKPISGQYYIADYVSWIPWLTLLDLQIALKNVFLEWNSFQEFRWGLLYVGYYCIKNTFFLNIGFLYFISALFTLNTCYKVFYVLYLGNNQKIVPGHLGCMSECNSEKKTL